MSYIKTVLKNAGCIEELHPIVCTKAITDSTGSVDKSLIFPTTTTTVDIEIQKDVTIDAAKLNGMTLDEVKDQLYDNVSSYVAGKGYSFGGLSTGTLTLPITSGKIVSEFDVVDVYNGEVTKTLGTMLPIVDTTTPSVSSAYSLRPDMKKLTDNTYVMAYATGTSGYIRIITVNPTTGELTFGDPQLFGTWATSGSPFIYVCIISSTKIMILYGGSVVGAYYCLISNITGYAATFSVAAAVPNLTTNFVGNGTDICAAMIDSGTAIMCVCSSYASSSIRLLYYPVFVSDTDIITYGTGYSYSGMSYYMCECIKLTNSNIAFFIAPMTSAAGQCDVFTYTSGALVRLSTTTLPSSIKGLARRPSIIKTSNNTLFGLFNGYPTNSIYYASFSFTETSVSIGAYSGLGASSNQYDLLVTPLSGNCALMVYNVSSPSNRLVFRSAKFNDDGSFIFSEVNLAALNPYGAYYYGLVGIPITDVAAVYFFGNATAGTYYRKVTAIQNVSYQAVALDAGNSGDIIRVTFDGDVDHQDAVGGTTYTNTNVLPSVNAYSPVSGKLSVKGYWKT